MKHFLSSCSRTHNICLITFYFRLRLTKYLRNRKTLLPSNSISPPFFLLLLHMLCLYRLKTKQSIVISFFILTSFKEAERRKLYTYRVYYINIFIYYLFLFISFYEFELPFDVMSSFQCSFVLTCLLYFVLSKHIKYIIYYKYTN